MSIIPIYFAFDNYYVVPAIIAFWSLLNKSSKSSFWKMYVLHHDITSRNQDVIRDCLSKYSNFTIEFINTKEFLKDKWINGNFENHNKGNQFTTDTLIKCFGSRFFSNYDKIIYSDVDVLFADSIECLYDINIENDYIAGVRNPFMMSYSNELSHLNKKHYETIKNIYVAGGIWLMNLKKIREDDIESKMMSVINDDCILKRWPDQDIINIACSKHISHIPLNFISYPYLLDVINKKNFISHYTREELYDSIINPKIIHWAGIKPWNTINCCLRQMWLTIYFYLQLDKKIPEFHVVKDNRYNRILEKFRNLKNRVSNYIERSMNIM